MEIPLNVVIYCLVLGLALAGAARVRKVLSCIHPTIIRTAKKRPRRTIRPRWSCALARPIYVPLVEHLSKFLPMWWGSTFWCLRLRKPPIKEPLMKRLLVKRLPRNGPLSGKPPAAGRLPLPRLPAIAPAPSRRQLSRKKPRSAYRGLIDRSVRVDLASRISRSTDFACRPRASWTGHSTGSRIN